LAESRGRELVVSSGPVADGLVEIVRRRHRPGPAEAVRANLFQPFFHHQGRPEWVSGFSISRTIIESHAAS